MHYFQEPAVYPDLIDRFRFHTPHITRFYNENHCVTKEFPAAEVLTLPLNQGQYISPDGHTRLYYAVMKNRKSIRAVTESPDDWVYGFVEEARKRNIHTPSDLILVSLISLFFFLVLPQGEKYVKIYPHFTKRFKEATYEFFREKICK